jgi:hypothetical protein
MMPSVVMPRLFATLEALFRTTEMLFFGAALKLNGFVIHVFRLSNFKNNSVLLYKRRKIDNGAKNNTQTQISMDSRRMSHVMCCDVKKASLPYHL